MMNLFMGHHEEPHVALHLFAAVPHGLYAEIFPDPNPDPMWFELALRAAAHQVWANVCSAARPGICAKFNARRNCYCSGSPIASPDGEWRSSSSPLAWSAGNTPSDGDLPVFLLQ
jgi:hypothetical protein